MEGENSRRNRPLSADLPLLESMHRFPNVMQRFRVSPITVVTASRNCRFEVVVVNFARKLGGRLRPVFLRYEQTECVVGRWSFDDLRSTKRIRQSRLKNFEMTTEASANHDPMRIDGLAAAAIALSSADNAEESILREEPHVSHSKSMTY